MSKSKLSNLEPEACHREKERQSPTQIRQEEIEEMSRREASFLRRFAAVAIDHLILWLFWLPLLGLFIPWGSDLSYYLSWFIEGAYHVYFWTKTGQTPGKKLLGLKVISSDGSLIGWRKACLRLLGYYLNLLACGLGFLWILGDKQKQGWHDKIAGTYVIKV